MAIIWKFRVDAASGMHSLPSPVAVHLRAFQHSHLNWKNNSKAMRKNDIYIYNDIKWFHDIVWHDIVCYFMSIQTIHDYSATVRSTSTQNHSSHAFQHEAQWPNQTHAESPWISCLHMLPNHAVASINCRWAWSFAAFAALGAAPVLLRRWPCLSCDMLRLAFSVFAAAPLTCLTTQSQTFSTT